MVDNEHKDIPCIESVDGQSEKPRADIYLVHGTWAPEAPWTDKNSTLTKTIMEARIPGVHVRRLVWSGKNRQSHREKAAKCLARELDANPTTPTVLIGHSHGGSVIHSALMQLKTEEHVCGNVCFNTPFLVTLRRNIKARLPATFWFWVFGGIWAPLLLARVSPTVFLLTGVVWLAGVLLLPKLFLGKFLSEQQKSLVSRRKPCASRFLCLTTADDEAFGILSTIEAICNLPVLLLSPWLLWLYMLFSIVLVAGGVLPLIMSPNSGWWSVIVSYVGSVFIWSAAFYFVPFVLAAPAGIIVLRISQGIKDSLAPSQGIKDSLIKDSLAPYLVRSLVSLVPLSANVEFEELTLESGAGLAHSLLYKDKEVCKRVVRWVKESLKDCQKPKRKILTK